MHFRPLVFRLAFASVAALRGSVVSAAAADVAAASALRNAGRHVEARAAFEKIVVAAPNNPEANYALGMYACEKGEWQKALEYAARAVTQQPDTARYQYGWGAANGVSALKSGVLSKFGYARKCLAGYLKAVQLEPNNLQYRFALLNYYQQAPSMVGGGMDKAYVQAEEIRKLNEVSGRQAYTQLYVAEKKYDLAFKQYDHALTSTPPDYFALYSFGRLTLIASQRLDEGLVALKRCLEITPADASGPTHAHVQWRIGSVCERLGRPEDARAAYEAALKIDPKLRPAQQALDKLNAAKK